MKGWGPTTFPSHEAVVCLRCKTSLGGVKTTPALAMLQVGAHAKKCPKCHLVTSYDVSPAEAAAIEYEEPDWKVRFEEHCARWPRLPRYLQEDSAFEATMRDYRKWHAKDKIPAPAFDAMVALSVLGIMPPRNLIKDVKRDGVCFEEQHDNHMWLTMSQRAWRIIAVEDKTLVLDSFGEQTQIDLSRAKWAKYIEKAAEALEALRKKEGPLNASTADPL